MDRNELDRHALKMWGISYLRDRGAVERAFAERGLSAAAVGDAFDAIQTHLGQFARLPVFQRASLKQFELLARAGEPLAAGVGGLSSERIELWMDIGESMETQSSEELAPVLVASAFVMKCCDDCGEMHELADYGYEIEDVSIGPLVLALAEWLDGVAGRLASADL